MLIPPPSPVHDDTGLGLQISTQLQQAGRDGVIITHIANGGPAARAGNVQVGDIILEVDGTVSLQQ